MTQTIEQLTTRVRELEEFKANVVKECASIIKHAHKDIAKQLAASQLHAEQLLEALSAAEKTIDIVWVSHHANRCDHALELCRKALAQQSDTSALDSFVAEKVKEYGDEARRQMQHATKAVWQRDLAVDALERVARYSGQWAQDVVGKTMAIIRESENENKPE